MSASDDVITRNDEWVIQKLRGLIVTGKNNEEIEFVIRARPLKSLEEPAAQTQETTILRLQEISVIQVRNSHTTRSAYGRDYVFFIQVLQPKFNTFYSKITERSVKESGKRPNAGSSSELNLPFDKQTEFLKLMVEENEKSRRWIETAKYEMREEREETRNESRQSEYPSRPLTNSSKINEGVVVSIFFKINKESDSRIQYVVNNNFSEIRHAYNKGHWKNMYKVAKHQSLKLESPTKAKSLKDYFNSERRNRLWSDQRFKQRPLLSILAKTLIQPVDGIILKTLTERAWVLRANKFSNRQP